jgi:RimJ/RimL family protein N-acetyltransferase
MHNTASINMPTHLESERLYLRAYEPGDGKWYVGMCQRNKAHLARYEGGNPAMRIETEAQAEALIRDFITQWKDRKNFFMGTWEKASDTFVAQIYIGLPKPALPEFEIGYFVDAGHEGSGFVTEAVKAVLVMLFEQVKAHRVMIRGDDTNTRSAGVAERCGFVREGHLREDHPHDDGSITGTLIYGMLYEDFLKAAR